MSRVGKRPIAIPKGVEVQSQERVVRLKGPKGQNQFALPELVEVDVEGDEIRVKADYLNSTRARALMGTVQACLSNMVEGVSKGFTRRLQLVGVGYRAAVQGQNLELQLGFSHPVKVELPGGVKAQVEGNNNQIVLTSHDNVLLGQTAANIRAIRPPEPYQGKGVMYENERIRRKAGKTGKK
jgi:large subunit ribosomal protein L6